MSFDKPMPSLYPCYCGHYFFLKTFLMWIIFKVFTEFVTILLLFYALIFLAKRHVGS